MARKCKNCKQPITHGYIDPYCNNKCYYEYKDTQEPGIKKGISEVREANKRKEVRRRELGIPPKLQDLINELDTVFSRRVKLIHTKIHERPGYYKVHLCQCYTCDHRKMLEEIQAGHRIGRRQYMYRYSALNVKPQCDDCNHKLKGNGKYKEFKAKLILENGSTVIEKMEGNKTSTFQRSYGRYIEKIAHYKTEVMKLEKSLDIA